MTPPPSLPCRSPISCINRPLAVSRLAPTGTLLSEQLLIASTQPASHRLPPPTQSSPIGQIYARTLVPATPAQLTASSLRSVEPPPTASSTLNGAQPTITALILRLTSRSGYLKGRRPLT